MQKMLEEILRQKTTPQQCCYFNNEMEELYNRKYEYSLRSSINLQSFISALFKNEM